MIIVSGTIRIDAANRDQAQAAAVAVATASREEEGCSAYGFWADLEDPELYRVYEEWESEEAIATHFATPHMAEFMAAIGQLNVSEMDIYKFEIGSKGPLFG